MQSKKVTGNNKLICHGGAVSNVVQSLHVNVEPEPQGALHLRFQLTGDLPQIDIPAPRLSLAVDGLWEHTCFEVFVAVEGDANYHEFNFSPSGQWAAYAFSGYRIRSAWLISQAPIIHFIKTSEQLLLEAVIAAVDLPENITGKPFQLGLTAVIKVSDGSRSYWALRHPETHPDFHHRAGFIALFNQSLPTKI
ncbi:DOMON-like domain-containing protein [Methylobacter sp. S3L5C]|uniref:DOMON-like domain-containing protein n=1 Tax=Methylobacter sp. S3L5C TaxID=2839024 RepID=UPI001FAE6D72|nr:DOMON-like domain-containing protein [Methylobacter sp. S3L5C]UOA09788.1 DOMON-like domain-containing protein [Methylobacter sp. S3L5C]